MLNEFSKIVIVDNEMNLLAKLEHCLHLLVLLLEFYYLLTRNVVEIIS